MSKKIADYTWQIGPYKTQHALTDDDDADGRKINTLINLLHTIPGTLQDVPEFGIDAMQYLFVENDTEINEAIGKVQTEIQAKSNKFIEIGFVDSIVIKTSDGSILGAKDIQFEIYLKNSKFLSIQSYLKPKTGLRLTNVMINTSKFTATN